MGGKGRRRRWEWKGREGGVEGSTKGRGAETRTIMLLVWVFVTISEASAA